MLTLRRSLAALALAAALSACSQATDITDPLDLRANLRGTWAEPIDIPGARFEFTLSVADTTLSGAGIFAIEAGASGSSTVSGVVAGQQVLLDFLDSIGRKQHFVGRLEAPDLLRGSFWQESTTFGSDPIVITFRRTSH